MQYKKLDTEDFIVGYNPVIEPAGADDGGLLVLTTDYTTGQGNIAGPDSGTGRVYRQFANIIQGDSTSNLPIGSSFYYITIFRSKFKESIHPSTFQVDGTKVNTGSADVNYCNAGREYSNTAGTLYLYPDIGVALRTTAFSNVYANSEEINTIANVFIRAGASEFNYSTNPSFLDENDYVRFTEFAYDPKVYLTTIGLYNDNGDCLAVAKLPKPTKKDFNTDLLFKVELKF